MSDGCSDCAKNEAERFRRMQVLGDISAEREFQLKKWGHQSYPSGTRDTAKARELRDRARALCDRRAELGKVTWADILTEEYSEAMAEVEHEALRKELVQTAAVIVAWLEDLDAE